MSKDFSDIIKEVIKNNFTGTQKITRAFGICDKVFELLLQDKK